MDKITMTGENNSHTCNSYTQKPCPHCQPELPIDNSDQSQCVLNKPLMIHIPSEGIHLSCPIHSNGHHIFGQQIKC